MPEYILARDQFQRIEHLLPGREGCPGGTAKDNYLFLNAILYILKNGTPWRQLPEEYGHWKNVHKRFSRWCKSGVFNIILDALAKEKDKKAQMLLLDSSVVRAHQHAAGAVSPVGDEALGRSRGGFSTKIHASVALEAVKSEAALPQIAD